MNLPLPSPIATAVRPTLKIALSANPSSYVEPPLAALFLITFDPVSGYTLSWSRALPGVELEGDVEYKCLPSGLHTVSEDLVYFVSGKRAGVAAFVRKELDRHDEVEEPAEERRLRGARMISVGCLVEGRGRMGRCWVFAEGLKALAE